MVGFFGVPRYEIADRSGLRSFSLARALGRLADIEDTALKQQLKMLSPASGLILAQSQVQYLPGPPRL